MAERQAVKSDASVLLILLQRQHRLMDLLFPRYQHVVHVIYEETFDWALDVMIASCQKGGILATPEMDFHTAVAGYNCSNRGRR